MASALVENGNENIYQILFNLWSKIHLINRNIFRRTSFCKTDIYDKTPLN